MFTAQNCEEVERGGAIVVVVIIIVESSSGSHFPVPQGQSSLFPLPMTRSPRSGASHLHQTHTFSFFIIPYLENKFDNFNAICVQTIHLWDTSRSRSLLLQLHAFFCVQVMQI